MSAPGGSGGAPPLPRAGWGPSPLLELGRLARAYEVGLGKYGRASFLEPSQAQAAGERIHRELEKLLTRSKP